MATPQGEKNLAPVVQRAPFDLDCPAEQLTYKNLGSYVIGVTGCGRRATYKAVYGVGWVMNSAAENNSSAASEPAPASVPSDDLPPH